MKQVSMNSIMIKLRPLALIVMMFLTFTLYQSFKLKPVAWFTAPEAVEDAVRLVNAQSMHVVTLVAMWALAKRAEL